MSVSPTSGRISWDGWCSSPPCPTITHSYRIWVPSLYSPRLKQPLCSIQLLSELLAPLPDQVQEGIPNCSSLLAPRAAMKGGAFRASGPCTCCGLPHSCKVRVCGCLLLPCWEGRDPHLRRGCGSACQLLDINDSSVVGRLICYQRHPFGLLFRTTRRAAPLRCRPVLGVVGVKVGTLASLAASILLPPARDSIRSTNVAQKKRRVWGDTSGPANARSQVSLGGHTAFK